MKKRVLKSQAETTTIHVTGIVIPIAWNRDGKPKRLAISAHGEQEYVIDRRAGKGREVTRLLREWIQADGVINKSGAIIIRRYTVMENENADITRDPMTGIIEMLLPILISICTGVTISFLAA